MTSPFSYTSPVVSVDALKHSIAYKLMFIIGKDPTIATQHDWLNATLFAVRDRMVERWLRSNRAQLSQDVRQVYYLSMEFYWAEHYLTRCYQWGFMMRSSRRWMKWASVCQSC